MHGSVYHPSAADQDLQLVGQPLVDEEGIHRLSGQLRTGRGVLRRTRVSLPRQNQPR